MWSEIAKPLPPGPLPETERGERLSAPPLRFGEGAGGRGCREPPSAGGAAGFRVEERYGASHASESCHAAAVLPRPSSAPIARLRRLRRGREGHVLPRASAAN